MTFTSLSAIKASYFHALAHLHVRYIIGFMKHKLYENQKKIEVLTYAFIGKLINLRESQTEILTDDILQRTKL